MKKNHLFFFLLLLSAFSKKKTTTSHFSFHHQDDSDWRVINQKADTVWRLKYEWPESPNFFACGIAFEFADTQGESRNINEALLVPTLWYFYLCDIKDWNTKLTHGTTFNLDDPKLQMCPENNFIIGIQSYWTKDEIIRSVETDIFRFKIICAPQLSFLAFAGENEQDPIEIFENKLICGYLVGNNIIKYSPEIINKEDEYNFASGFAVKLCDNPNPSSKENKYWVTINDGFYGKWMKPTQWSNRFIDYYGCGINLRLLSPQNPGFIGANDDAPIQGINFFICNLFDWNAQREIEMKDGNKGNWLGKGSKTMCPSNKFITGMQIKYDFSKLGEDALGVTGIKIKCGNILDFTEASWIDLDTRFDKGIWLQKKYFYGGVCGALLKWNTDRGPSNLFLDDDTAFNGLNIQVCPEFNSKIKWVKVFSPSFNNQIKKISWKENNKDFFGCGIILYLKKLITAYAFLAPVLPMHISVIACKKNQWDDYIINGKYKTQNDLEIKRVMCPKNEFIVGIQGGLKDSPQIFENNIKEDIFRFRIICGPSMKFLDVYAGNRNLQEMFQIPKIDDSKLYFKNGLIVGYSWQLFNIEFFLKKFNWIEKDVLNSLSFQLDPIPKEFYSNAVTNRWKSMEENEIEEGVWGKIFDWSEQKNVYLNGVSLKFKKSDETDFLESIFFSNWNAKTMNSASKFTLTEREFGKFYLMVSQQNKYISGVQLKTSLVKKTELITDVKFLSEFLEGDSTFEDWSVDFNNRKGNWKDPQFLMYGGKKAFVCGVVGKFKKILISEEIELNPAIDFDFKMCSPEIDKIQISQKTIKTEGEEKGIWANLIDWNTRNPGHYACGLRVSRKTVNNIAFIIGIEIKTCNKNDYSNNQLWEKLEEGFVGNWEEPISCADKKFIAGIQLKFRNVNPILDEFGQKELIKGKKGEVVGLRIVCRQREKNFNEEKWMSFYAETPGVWGERNYFEDQLLMCGGKVKKNDEKFCGLELKTCKE